jgi:hypothetical protein
MSALVMTFTGFGVSGAVGAERPRIRGAQELGAGSWKLGDGCIACCAMQGEGEGEGAWPDTANLVSG